jgi:hypothetical protein
MSADLRNEVWEAAEARGMTESEWLRSAVARELAARELVTSRERLPGSEALPHEEALNGDRLQGLG